MSVNRSFGPRRVGSRLLLSILFVPQFWCTRTRIRNNTPPCNVWIPLKRIVYIKKRWFCGASALLKRRRDGSIIETVNVFGKYASVSGLCKMLRVDFVQFVTSRVRKFHVDIIRSSIVFARIYSTSLYVRSIESSLKDWWEVIAKTFFFNATHIRRLFIARQLTDTSITSLLELFI